MKYDKMTPLQKIAELERLRDVFEDYDDELIIDEISERISRIKDELNPKRRRKLGKQCSATNITQLVAEYGVKQLVSASGPLQFNRLKTLEPKC